MTGVEGYPPLGGREGEGLGNGGRREKMHQRGKENSTQAKGRRRGQ